MEEVVCWDLDSSLASTIHRRYLIPKILAGEATWDDYSMRCFDDPPIEGAVALMRLLTDLDPEVRHVAVSGRSARAQFLTQQWAVSFAVPLSRYMLRPDGDRTPNGEWKVSCIRQLQAEGLRVRLFVEDWGPAAAYIREHTGISVLGLNPFDPGTTLVTREGLADALETELCTDPESAAKLADGIFRQLPGGV